MVIIAAPTPPPGDFKEYIELRHPRYDWKECLDLLKKIYEYNTHGRNPRTSELASTSHMTEETVRRRAEAMNPKYLEIHKCRFFVFTDSMRYYDRSDQKAKLDKLLGELETFMGNAPRIIDEKLLAKLTLLYSTILDMRTEGDLFWTGKKYHKFIEILDDKEITHNLRDAIASRRAIIFIFVDSRPYFDPEEQKEEFEKLFEKLEDFLQNAPEISDEPLLEPLNSLYEEILNLKAEDLYEAVGKYHELIQTFNDNGIIHNLHDVREGRNGAIFFTDPELYFDRDEQEGIFNKLLKELKLFLPSIELYKPILFEKLNLCSNEILDLVQENLYKAVRKYHGLIEMLYENEIEHPLRDADVKGTSYRYTVTSEGEVLCSVS